MLEKRFCNSKPTIALSFTIQLAGTFDPLGSQKPFKLVFNANTESFNSLEAFCVQTIVVPGGLGPISTTNSVSAIFNAKSQNQTSLDFFRNI